MKIELQYSFRKIVMIFKTHYYFINEFYNIRLVLGYIIYNCF